MTRARNEVKTDDAVREEIQAETWQAWPVNWSAVWVGALAALAAVVLFGLIGVAVGAHVLDREVRIVDLRKTSLWAMALTVFGAFFAFVIGGWVAGKVAGILRSEPAMLHGAIVWLATGPLLIVLAALGAGSVLGAWFGGLASISSTSPANESPFVAPLSPGQGASEAEWTQYRSDLATYREQVRQWREETPAAMRNSALGAVTAMLLGLVGSVIGGWLACGEPMTLTYYRTRPQRVAVRT